MARCSCRSARPLAVPGARAGRDRHDVTLGTRRLPLCVYADGERVAVFAPEGRGDVREVDVIAHAGEGAADGGRLTAPMPGKVIAFLAKAGDAWHAASRWR